MVWGKLNGTNDLIRAIPFNNEIYDNFSKMESEQSSFQNKKFICFNRMPRLQRIVFFNLLSKYKLINEGYVSFPEQNFGTFPSNLDYSNYLKNTLQFDNDLRTSLIKMWKSEIKNLPYIVDTNDWNPNLYGLMTSEIYKKTYFSIVTESLYNDVSVFVDEKIWKPMYNNHPLIIQTPKVKCIRKNDSEQLVFSYKWEEFKRKYNFPLPVSPERAVIFLDEVRQAKAIQVFQSEEIRK